uniref:AP2/ERF domain-containing protein n=1 Tax=viral metagenome TaxID=1070528 RepID=A0A6C0DWA2_9ZZZZ
MEIQNKTLNIVTLIEKNPITRFKETYNNRFIEKIKDHFTSKEQQIFLGSFYTYLNYNSKTDFIIDLDNVWKWLGFSRKDNCKTVLLKHFTKEIDYKIFAPEVAGAKDTKDIDKLCYENRGGHNKEQVLLNIETFKGLCMLAGTEKSKEVRMYYLKLEEVLQEVILEESKELQDQLQEKIEKIQMLENKPEMEGFYSKSGYIYLIKDTASLGAYKIGLGENPDRRLITLNVSSSQKSLKMIKMFKSDNMRYAEKMIHILLEPFRIKRRNEWFFLSDNTELNYVIHTIKNSIEYTDKYNFVDYNSFKDYANQLEDKLKNITEENICFEKPKKYVNSNFICRTDKLSKYNGVSWCIKEDKWMVRITKDNDTIFLGKYDTELEAAIIYNDYATYLNRTLNMNYRLNDIDNYVSNPRDIPEEWRKKKLETKSSQFNGVYFIKSKQIFEASIQYKKKSYKLIKNESDIECAKLYNQQALYFNNHFGTNYKLNDIENFTTVEKNYISSIKKKYSRFIGVSIRNDSDKFRAYIKYNGKRIDCGTFKNEEDAARAYNKKAEELNALETTKIKYMINEVS